MGFSRKQALGRITTLWPQLQDHYRKLLADPEHRDADHWRDEMRGWLQQMKVRLPYVGKKTAAEWQARLKRYWDAVQD